MNVDKILEQIDVVGQYLAEKLAVPMDMAYDVLMAQVRFEMVWATVLTILGFIMVIIPVLWFKSYYNKHKDERYWYDEWPAVIGIIISLILTLLGVPTFFLNLYTTLQIAINPEWYMIQMILEKVQ